MNDTITVETEAQHLATELRDGFLLLTSLFFLGLSQGNSGGCRWRLATLNAAIDQARSNGDRFWYPRMPNCIGWIHRELQDFAGALRFDQQGVEVARKHGVLEAEANSLINLGIDYVHAGESEKTAAAFDEVHDIFKRDAWFRWRYNIRLQAVTAHHWLQRGDPARGRDFALRLLETAKDHEAHKYIAVAHRLLAQAALEAGDPAEAEQHCDAALKELKEYPAPLVAWKTYTDLATLKLQLGDHSAAREAFAEAAKIVNSIAENISDDALRTTFLTSDAVREVLQRMSDDG